MYSKVIMDVWTDSSSHGVFASPTTWKWIVFAQAYNNF